jgi:hypothetical protein
MQVKQVCSDRGVGAGFEVHASSARVRFLVPALPCARSQGKQACAVYCLWEVVGLYSVTWRCGLEEGGKRSDGKEAILCGR